MPKATKPKNYSCTNPDWREIAAEIANATDDHASINQWNRIAFRVPRVIIDRFLADISLSPPRNPAACFLAKIRDWNGGDFTGIFNS